MWRCGNCGYGNWESSTICYNCDYEGYAAEVRAQTAQQAKVQREANAPPLCSFCGKSHNRVQKMIAGPSVYICDSCINVCKNILDKELGIPSPPEQKVEARLDMLAQLYKTKKITTKEYRTKRKEIVDQL